MHGLASSTEDDYRGFMSKTEKHYLEDKNTTQNGKDRLTAILQSWYVYIYIYINDVLWR